MGFSLINQEGNNMEMYAIMCICGGEIGSFEGKYICPDCDHELTDEEIDKLLDQTYEEHMKTNNKKRVFMFDDECVVISPWTIKKTAKWYIDEYEEYESLEEGSTEYQEKYEELLNADELDTETCGIWCSNGKLAQGNVDYKQSEECTTFGDKQSPEGYVEIYTRAAEVIGLQFKDIVEPVML
jgi:hypothetical protein